MAEAATPPSALIEGGEAKVEAEGQPNSDPTQAEPTLTDIAQPELTEGVENVASEPAVAAAEDEKTEQPPEQEGGTEQLQPAEQQQGAMAAGDELGEQEQAAAGPEERPGSEQPQPQPPLPSDPAQDVNDGSSEPADGQGAAEPPETSLPAAAEQLPVQADEDHPMVAEQPEELPAALPAAEELPLDPTLLPTLSSSGMSIRQYLDTTVVPVLRLGLRELVKARPADPFDYLSDFIRDNKPK